MKKYPPEKRCTSCGRNLGFFFSGRICKKCEWKQTKGGRK